MAEPTIARPRFLIGYRAHEPDDRAPRLRWRLVRWFLFRLDAETAHKLTLVLLAHSPGWLLDWMGRP
jgi:hypothetical protein